MPLEAGTRVGRYTIVRLIAQGGMAEVYRAEQEITAGVKRPAAVKLIRPEYSESEDFRQMFLDEARTACTLSHPNIVHIYEVGESDDGSLYMAMELVPGETLATINRTLRQNEERFSDEALFSIGISTASALEAAHALKVEAGQVNLVHRDVSPHNLLLSASGNLKLIDFGIAKAATNRNLTMPGVTKGKAGYFSPEQAMGRRLDGRSDLFSLGVTLYKLASGVTPFDDWANHGERHAALVRGQWRPLLEVFPGLPDGFYAVVDRALMLKPDERFATAREMREELEKAAFDAQVRVSQSSLLGYVDDDGEVTASGGTRSSMFPNAGAAISAPPTRSSPSQREHQVAVTSPPQSRPSLWPASSKPSLPPASAPRPPTKEPAREPVQEAHTERVAARRRGPAKTVYVLAFAAAVIIGVFGIMLLFGAPEPRLDPSGLKAPLTHPVTPPVVEPPDTDPVTMTPPVVVVERRTDRPGERPVDVAVVERRTDRPDVGDAGPSAKPKGPPKNPHVAVRPRPPPGDRAPTGPPVGAVTPAKPDVPEPASIPAGQGKLRIGATNAAVVAGVVVGPDDWGPPPVNRPVSSGTYVVVLKLSDGRRSAPWKGAVLPDRTTTLVYDVDGERWSVK